MRYGKYSLQNSLWLDDGFCDYYVQDDIFGQGEILDVETMIFFEPEEAFEWLHCCAEHDSFNTLTRLRRYLSEYGMRSYMLFRMNDKQVLHAAAEELTLNKSRVVIKPSFGWAVQPATDPVFPELPRQVEPEPDLEVLVLEIKGFLDDLVAEQQRKYDQYEAELAGLSEEEKRHYYADKIKERVYDDQIGSLIDTVKALPGFIHRRVMKTLNSPTNPVGLYVLLTRSIMERDLRPLEESLDETARSLALTYEQTKKFKTMALVLFQDEEISALLSDFAHRYWEATHPVERAQLGASAVTDVVILIILALLSAGAGAAASIMTKSGKLTRVAKLLEKLSTLLKRTGGRRRIPKNDLADSAGTVAKATKKVKKGGVPEVKSPKKKPDGIADKEYSRPDKNDGPKTTKPKPKFKDPKAAYAYVNSLKDDTAKIAKQRIKGLSKEEAKQLKAEIREWAPEEDYPGIDYSKIDKEIEKYNGKDLTKQDVDQIKDYVFKDEFLAPKADMPKQVNDAYIGQAEKWIKLSEGKGGPAEMTFLKHELAEMTIKKQGGLEKLGETIGKDKFLTHDDAHTAVEQIFDCTK